jgi:hypothetical protein
VLAEPGGMTGSACRPAAVALWVVIRSWRTPEHPANAFGNQRDRRHLWNRPCGVHCSDAGHDTNRTEEPKSFVECAPHAVIGGLRSRHTQRVSRVPLPFGLTSLMHRCA